MLFPLFSTRCGCCASELIGRNNSCVISREGPFGTRLGALPRWKSTSKVIYRLNFNFRVRITFISCLRIVAYNERARIKRRGKARREHYRHAILAFFTRRHAPIYSRNFRIKNGPYTAVYLRRDRVFDIGRRRSSLLAGSAIALNISLVSKRQIKLSRKFYTIFQMMRESRAITYDLICMG